MQEPALPAPISEHLTTRSAVLIASRLFTVYLLFWVVVDAIGIPSEILAIVHYAREGTNQGFSIISTFHLSYYLRLEILYLLANTLKAALWLIMAGWFYRCGPRIQNFFFPSDPTQTIPPNSQPS